MYCMHKKEPQKPQEHTPEHVKSQNFLGTCPQNPLAIYITGLTFCTWPGPLQSSRQPCLPPEEEIPCLRTSSCRPTHFHQVLQVGSWVHPETVCPLVWDSKETMYCFTRFRCNSSVFLCELWLTKECQFGSHYYRTAILGYLNSEYSHRICLWIQNCILTIDSLSASTFSSDCVGWSLSSSMYS